jgi:hypothetical protein
MELVVNDLSLHGQYAERAQLQMALQRVLQIRDIARRFGRSVLCQRQLVQRAAIGSRSMREVVGELPLELRRALLSWLDRLGPYWEDERAHDEDQWLEERDRIVTGHAIAEAAFRVAHGLNPALVSFAPSDYNHTPIQVRWLHGHSAATDIEVSNHWDPAEVEVALKTAEPPVTSWSQLDVRARNRFPGLEFSSGAFGPLDGHPFVQPAANRFLLHFHIFNRFKQSHDADGRRTEGGQRLYDDHFMGDKAAFSDSSDSEKSDFKSEMTFPHPEGGGKTLFCPFHGKVKTPQLRAHFTWPVQKDQPIRVVYVGPKLTKR